MLHMKHRHVLMDRDLEPGRGSGAQQSFELGDVEIVGGGHAFQPVPLQEITGGQRIGDIERIVAPHAPAAEKRQMVVVADQIPIGAGRQHLLEHPFLARFEDARWRDPDRGCLIFNLRFLIGGGRRRLPVAEGGDGLAITLRVFEFAVDRAGSGRPGGFQLVRPADDHDQLGRWGGSRHWVSSGRVLDARAGPIQLG